MIYGHIGRTEGSASLDFDKYCMNKCVFAKGSHPGPPDGFCDELFLILLLENIVMLWSYYNILYVIEVA